MAFLQPLLQNVSGSTTLLQIGSTKQSMLWYELMLRMLLLMMMMMMLMMMMMKMMLHCTELGQALQLQSTVQLLVDPDSMSPNTVSCHCVFQTCVDCGPVRLWMQICRILWICGLSANLW